MKANEAPEKIYIFEQDFQHKDHKVMYGVNQDKDIKGLIEYTRTDDFIEKACKWIREFNNHHYIMRYSDSCEPPLSELTEWFRNYMEGE